MTRTGCASGGWGGCPARPPPAPWTRKSRHQHLAGLGTYVRLGEATSARVTADTDPAATTTSDSASAENSPPTGARNMNWGCCALRVLQSALGLINTLMIQDTLALPEWENVLTDADRR